MNYGEFSNISPWTTLVIRGYPKIIISGAKLVGRATRINANTGMLELIAFCSEAFEFAEPETYKQDGIAFRVTHPYWQFAPVTDSLKLDGACLCSMYLSSGGFEGRYIGQSGVQLYGNQGYLISMYLNETSLGRNGKAEKFCLQFPAPYNKLKPFDIVQGGWLKVTVISEFTKLTIPQTIQRRLSKPVPFTAEEEELLRAFREVQRKYD